MAKKRVYPKGTMWHMARIKAEDTPFQLLKKIELLEPKIFKKKPKISMSNPPRKK